MSKTIQVHDRNKKIAIFTDHIASVEELDESNRYSTRILLSSGDWVYCDESYETIMEKLK